MKTEIKSLGLMRMRQAEDYAFHTLAIAELEAEKEKSGFQTQLDNYKSAYDAFDAVLKVSGGEDPLTKEVAAADEATDACYTGICAFVRAQRYHYDPLTAEIARRLVIIIDRYGNPTQQAYLQEYGVIDNLLQDFEKFDTETITLPGGGDGEEEEERPGGLLRGSEAHNLATLGLDGWVDRLRACRDRFMDVFTRRNAQQATIDTGAVKAARKTADEAYRSAVHRLNALVELDDTGKYDTLVRNLNNLIDRQKGVQAARDTRNAKKRGEEERPGGL